MERDVHARTLDAGRLLAALGAIALLVGLFLDWYESGFDDGRTASAWTVFELADVLLAALALLVLLAAARGLAPRSGLPAVPTGAVAGAAFAALVLVTVYLVNEPPLVHGATPAEGAWISFGGALLMALGALLRNSRVALVVSPRSEPAPPAAHEPPPTAPPPPGAREQTDTQVLPER